MSYDLINTLIVKFKIKNNAFIAFMIMIVCRISTTKHIVVVIIITYIIIVLYII